jgi:putative CocE/NonD family hydrolase
MGEEAWREEGAWPPAGARPLTFFLRAAAGGRRGGLAETPPAEAASASAFVSDPLDPVTDPFALVPGAHADRGLVERPDLLAFETAPFEAPLRALGPITARAYVSTDAPDTDLWFRLFDVAPDGTALNLMSPGLDVVRASYRSGGPKRELLTPGEVYALDFDHMLTGNLFKVGHRLRLVVSATFFPHYSRNLHTGALETEARAARKARVRVHHERAHASSLTVTSLP